MDKLNIAVLAGDGIGPEVMTQALRVLDAVAKKAGLNIETTEALIGGAAYDKFGEHFPKATADVCKSSNAILFGSVGGPVSESKLDKWRGCEANSLLGIRKQFNFYANFRPVRLYPELVQSSPLKKEVIGDGVDLIIIRELVGDIYFGEHKIFTRQAANGTMERVGSDVAEYTESQIREIAHVGFKTAQGRSKKLTSVDKANVLSTSKLWREVVKEVSADYPDVKLEDMLVDNCAMQLIVNPRQFDVIVTSNMFGDILSDAAAVLPGSLGLLASASLNKEGFGMFEPPGGSAPDIAGKGIANPTGQILSVAMMLRFAFGLNQEALMIEEAVSDTIKAGIRTSDIASGKSASTKEFTDAVLERLR
jgi:3-isopropylmalate dehydrogenase